VKYRRGTSPKYTPGEGSHTAHTHTPYSCYLDLDLVESKSRGAVYTFILIRYTVQLS